MIELKDWEKRVLEFDPTELFSRVKVNRYKRQQSIPMGEMFPNKKGYCGCGCERKLEGKSRRWFSKECEMFAVYVNSVINGRSEQISRMLRLKFTDWACCHCGVMDIYKEQKNGLVVNSIHKDHIVAVNNGGGGCWLDNYQLLCEDCHKKKTKLDLNHK